MGTVVNMPRATNLEPGRVAAFSSGLRGLAGRILNAMGAPGAIRSTELTDPLSGQKIEIRVGILFTRISINGRDYYFSRFRGRLDGTGCGCR